jgi:hypothetical protein
MIRGNFTNDTDITTLMIRNFTRVAAMAVMSVDTRLPLPFVCEPQACRVRVPSFFWLGKAVRLLNNSLAVSSL